MKKILATITLLVSSQTVLAGYVTGFDVNTWGTANERIETGRATTDDYVTNNKFYGYVMGVHDALDGFVFCSPQTAKAGQIQAVVKKYVREHPELWSKGGESLVAAALKEAFPCAK